MLALSNKLGYSLYVWLIVVRHGLKRDFPFFMVDLLASVWDLLFDNWALSLMYGDHGVTL